MNFLPPFGFWPALVLLAGALFFWRRAALRDRPLLPRPIFLSIAGLRGLLMAGLFLLLLNPFSSRTQPDPTGHHLTVLVDASASMQERDADGQSRWETVRQALDPADQTSWRSFLASRHALRWQAFGASLGPLRLDRPPAAAATDLSGALQEALQVAESSSRLGGLVLLSDGHQTGPGSPAAAALACGRAGIPVTVIGVGGGRAASDLAVRAVAPPGEGRVREALPMRFEVVNRGREPVSIPIALWEEDKVVEERSVTLEPGQSRIESFTVIPRQAGLRLYRARLSPPEPDANPANDTSYLPVKIQEPASFRVLICAFPSWETAFLRSVWKEDHQVQAGAVLALAPDLWMVDLPEAPPAGTREGAFPLAVTSLAEWDAVLLEARLANLLGADFAEGLTRFVAEAGGGLVVEGPPEAIPDKMRQLLPAKTSQEERPRDDAHWAVEGMPWPQRSAADSLANPPALFLPGGLPAWPAEELSRGATVAAATQPETGGPVFLYQNYGAGRVAWLATSDSWRWRFANRDENGAHQRFWRLLAGWLGSARKPRLDTVLNGITVPLGQAAPVAITVLDRALQSRPDAQVRVRLTAPGEEAVELPLQPSLREPGRYSAEYLPVRPGEHRLEWEAVFADGETIGRTTHFVAAPSGPESADTSFSEATLRDIARLSGGRYYSWRELDKSVQPELAARLPQRESRLYWTRHWLFLWTMAGLAGAEWMVRRRWGLR